MHKEIEQVLKRVPRWFVNIEQKNSKILLTYLRVSNMNQNSVYPSIVEKNCGLDKVSFRHHFNNMRNSSSTIGRVFQTNPDGTISLWQPVAEFILQEYNKAKL